MKNIKIILSVFITSLIFSSCEDAIDITQKGELYPETTYETVADLQMGLIGVYGVIPGENVISFTSIFTDEVRIGPNNGGQGLNDGRYNFLMLPGSSDAASIWTSYYGVINFANRLIDGAEGVEVEAGSADETDKNDILAQARIWRAYAHFQLLSFFSEDLTDDEELGVIMLDFVPTIDQSLPRSKNSEVFAFINSDLEYANSNLKENSNRKYLSKDFITALRARMEAYRGNYSEALDYAQLLINKYPLTIKAQYPLLWGDLVDGEVIFKLERTVGDPSVGSIWNTNSSDINGSVVFEMSTDLRNSLQLNDVRRDVFLDATSTNNIFVINKYPGSEGFALLNDIKLFRVSEMYLIKAEAQLDANDIPGAAATIKQIRDVRFGSAQTVSYNSEQQAWAGILQERRIELCFEGHRYLDIKRLGAKANVGINRNPADCAINNACTLDYNDYRFTLPIPTVEIIANKVIAPQQNTGY